MVELLVELFLRVHQQLLFRSYQIRLNELSKNRIKPLYLLDRIYVQLTGFDIISEQSRELIKLKLEGHKWFLGASSVVVCDAVDH